MTPSECSKPVSNVASRVAVVFTALSLVVSAPPGQAEEIDLFILAGQSNGVGYDAAPNQLPLDEADRKIPFFFDCGDPPFDGHDSSSSNRWTVLGPQPRGWPLAVDYPNRQYGNFSHAAGGFGPELSFARRLSREPGIKPAIFKFAYNGTGFSNPNDWSPGQPLYRDFISRYHSALGQLEQGGTNRVTLRALLWIQGETDCGRGTAAYAQWFGDFITQLRADLRSPALPVFAGFNTNFAGATAEIVQAQQRVAADVPRVFYVETGGAKLVGPPPVAHFNSVGTLEVGERFARAYLEKTK
jgi:hypothetical protein